jgi:hypothetical protein
MADAELLNLLREIRDRQAESLPLQREQFALYRQQWERAERINDRAEAVQARSLAALGGARWLLAGVGLALGVVLVLMAGRAL